MRTLVAAASLFALACGSRAPKPPVAAAPEPVPTCVIRGPAYTQPPPGPIDGKTAEAKP